MSPVEQLFRRPPHHIGYAVERIPSAVERWADLGVGPFFLFEHMEFDDIRYQGEPCVFDHSAAFAKLGDGFLELHEFFDVRPISLAKKLGAFEAPRFNHVAYVTATPEEDSARLAANGAPLYFVGKIGNYADRMHWVPTLGHTVEVHREDDNLKQLFTTIAQASDEWDGTNPLQTIELPAST